MLVELRLGDDELWAYLQFDSPALGRNLGVEFLLDTGAKGILIHESYIETLGYHKIEGANPEKPTFAGLRFIKHDRASGIGGSVPIVVCRCPKLSFAGVEFRDWELEIVVCPESEKPDNLLGLRFLKHFAFPFNIVGRQPSERFEWDFECTSRVLIGDMKMNMF